MENKGGPRSFGYLSDPSQNVPWDEAIKLHPSRKTKSYSIDIPSTKGQVPNTQDFSTIGEASNESSLHLLVEHSHIGGWGKKQESKFALYPNMQVGMWLSSYVFNCRCYISGTLH